MQGLGRCGRREMDSGWCNKSCRRCKTVRKGRPPGQEDAAVPLLDQSFSSLTVIGDQPGHIQPFDLPIHDPPLPADHDAVCPVRTAQQQGSDRVVAARKLQLVLLEKGQVRLLADSELADVLTPQDVCRSPGRPAQHPLGRDLLCPVA